jgi:hypothetical protein
VVAFIHNNDRVEAPTPKREGKPGRCSKCIHVARGDRPADSKRTIANVNANSFHGPSGNNTNAQCRM